MDTMIPAAAAQVAALSTVATWTTNFSSFHLLLDRVEQQLFIACAELCDDYAIYVLFRFCVQPRHFLVDWNGGDVGAYEYVFQRNCVSSEIRVHRRRHRSGEIVCIEAKLLVRVLLSARFMGI